MAEGSDQLSNFHDGEHLDGEYDHEGMAPLSFVQLIQASYFVASFFFIMSLSGLSNQETAPKGNWFGILGMTLAIVITFLFDSFMMMDFYRFIVAFIVGGLIGLILAKRVEMINMPQMVAVLHSFVGIAATLVGYCNFIKEGKEETDSIKLLETYIGIFIGAVTFMGSVIAWLKLDAKLRGEPLIILKGNGRHWVNLIVIVIVVILCGTFMSEPDITYLYIMTIFALFIGWHMVMAIGGADMPVVVSMLNSYSGWTTSASGFLLDNNLLIVSGALIGSSGAILSYIMCRAMNRSFVSVISGGFGIEIDMTAQVIEGEMVESQTNEVTEALLSAKKVIIVPGYGMAVARAQDVVGKLAKVLRDRGISTEFCIHPVAGRLPGHMNVLLAEANVPYNWVKEMDEVNEDFKKTDVVMVIGANDIVNPDALENPKSPIAGMPICLVWEAKRVFVIKRGKGKGYAAIENPLFFKKNTRMFYGNADKKVEEVLQQIAAKSGVQEKKKEEKKMEEHVVEEEQDEDLTPYTKLATKKIWVAKEVWPDERRVALVPKTVKKLVKLRFAVYVERGAGEASGFTDEVYIKNGAQIVDTKEVWEQGEVIFKIRPPSEYNKSLGYHEAQALQNCSLLVCQVYPGQNQELVNTLLNRKNLTVFAHDCVPRITRAQKLDTLSSQTNVAGFRAVIEAFHLLPRFSKAQITAAGKIPPANVFVIGAGVAGLAAIGLAKGMGAQVRAFDTREAAREQVESLGATLVKLEFQEQGAGTGGYGKEMSKEYYQAQHDLNNKEAKIADIIITTALIPGKKAPTLLYEDTVRGMKPNSVIIDMAAEMGGNCELTKKDQIHVDPQSQVTIFGLTNLPSRMAMQASELFSQNMYYLLEELIDLPLNKDNDARNFKINYQDEIQAGLTVIKNGELVWKGPGMAPPPQKPAEEKKEDKKDIKLDIGRKDDKLEEKESLLGKDHKQGQNQGTGCWDKINADPCYYALFVFVVAVIFTVLFGLGADGKLVTSVGIFILAIFTGYMVIWNVTPALHTPLMSVTNAISGIIVVGCMVSMTHKPEDQLLNFTPYSIVGTVGLFFASINIFGGFLVTKRMLSMFHR